MVIARDLLRSSQRAAMRQWQPHTFAQALAAAAAGQHDQEVVVGETRLTYGGFCKTREIRRPPTLNGLAFVAAIISRSALEIPPNG